MNNNDDVIRELRKLNSLIKVLLDKNQIKTKILIKQNKKNHLTLKEAADYLGISYINARINWPEWTKFGVIPFRYLGNPKASLRFRVSELEKMTEQWNVIKRGEECYE